METDRSKTTRYTRWLFAWGPLLLLMGVTSCSNQYVAGIAPDAPTVQNTIYAPRVDGIIVDGDLSEWAQIPGVDVSYVNGVWDQGVGEGKSTSASDCSYTFKVAWDSTGLYVGIEVTDDVIATDSTTPGEITTSPINRPWEDDTMEVFLDGDTSRTAYPVSCRNPADFRSGGEFSLVFNGAATSDESGFKEEFGTSWFGKTGTREGTYCYEYKLTWRVMGATSKPEKIGFTLSYQDDDDGGNAREHALYWQGRAENPPLYEDGWGTLYFVDSN